MAENQQSDNGSDIWQVAHTFVLVIGLWVIVAQFDTVNANLRAEKVHRDREHQELMTEIRNLRQDVHRFSHTLCDGTDAP